MNKLSETITIIHTVLINFNSGFIVFASLQQFNVYMPHLNILIENEQSNFYDEMTY